MLPDCRTSAGCLIPPLPENGQRILSLRSMRLALGNLLDPGTICRAFEAEYGALDWHDLSLLAAVEKELKPEPGAPDHG